MSLNPFKEKGTPMDKQVRSWKQIAQLPYKKQEVDAYTRCRVILMNGIETGNIIFSHNFARMSDDDALKAQLANIRRIESQQQTTINWLNPHDQTVLETTIAYEQVAVDLTAYLARTEPDQYMKDVLHFGLLEDFDHLYRYSQLLDLVEGKDPEEITQGKTDIFPGRPTQDHHNDPMLRLLDHYSKNKAHPISKANALTVLLAEQQTMMYYREHGFMYGGPDVREVYAEIAEVEEEHVTQYESLIDPNETWLEKWLMHEFVECANYYACYSMETDARIKQIWEQFFSFELEHLRIAGEALKQYENKDPEEVVGSELPTPGTFEENKEYVAKVLSETVDWRLAGGGKITNVSELPEDWPSYSYQAVVNADGCPTENAVQMRMMSAGVELLRAGDDLMQRASEFRMALDGEDAPNTAPESAEVVTPTADDQAAMSKAMGRY